MSEKIYHYVRPKLYPKQYDAFFCPQRYSIILGSTKSGKSVAGLAWLFERAISKKRTTGAFWWLAPTHKQAQVMYKRLKAYLPDFLYKPNDSEMSLTLLNGNVIAFKTAEVIDNLYGEDVWDLVVDEASRCRPEIWNVIKSVQTATQGSARLVANVKGRNWYWNMYQKYLSTPHPDYALHSLNAWDAVEAGVVPRQEIEDAQNSLPRYVFEELYLNIPADEGSNPFGQQDIARCVVPRLSTKPPRVWGWDLAKSVDWTVGIALDEDGVMCAFHRWQSSWESTVQQIRHLTGNTPALVDSSGVGDPILEQLTKDRGNFEGFKFTAPSKQQLMEGLAVSIQQQSIKFPDGECRRELDTFEYEYTRTGVRYNAPQGLHDDCVVALALANRKLRRPAARYLLDDDEFWS